MGIPVWHYRRLGSGHSRNRGDTPTAVASTCTSARLDASLGSNASPSTDAVAISAWADFRPLASPELARRWWTTGPRLRRVAHLAEKQAPPMPTFREAAHVVHEANIPRWRNARHIASWIQTLERHAMPTLGNTPLDHIDRQGVLRVLTAIWTTRPETARRVRQRMRTVLRWGMAHGFMESNPAGEAIDGALPRRAIPTELS